MCCSVVGGRRRSTAPAPDSAVDLAIHLDPATNLIHKLHFRGWTKENQGGMARVGGGMVIICGSSLIASLAISPRLLGL